MSLLDICVDGKGDEHRVPLRELCEGVRLQYELETQYRRKDGTSLPVISYLSAVSEQAPNQQTFLTLTVDVTARQAAEDALRTAQSELGRLARLTTVDAMAASIAHELNQPLASIVANGNAGTSLARSPGTKSRRGPLGVRARRSARVIALPRSSPAFGQCSERIRATGRR